MATRALAPSDELGEQVGRAPHVGDVARMGPHLGRQREIGRSDVDESVALGMALRCALERVDHAVRGDELVVGFRRDRGHVGCAGDAARCHQPHHRRGRCPLQRVVPSGRTTPAILCAMACGHFAWSCTHGPRAVPLASLAADGHHDGSPAWADSFASSASSAGSASLGSLSDSIGDSSKSSSPDTETADGDYRVIEVASWPPARHAAADAAGDRRQVKRASSRSGAARSARPQAASRWATSCTCATAPTAWSSRALNDAPTREAFFLVLADDWHGTRVARP